MVNADNSEVRIADAPIIPALDNSEENSKEASSIGDVCSSTDACSNSSVLPTDDDGRSLSSDDWHQRDEGPLFTRAESMLAGGLSPAAIVRQLFPEIDLPVEQMSNSTVMSILSEILDRPPKREKLSQYNTLQDAIELFRTRRKILILTGAGVSVSCGIPDFRSKDGIYARLHEDFPDLPDPTAMFDIRYFRSNPAPFYDFAKEIFPGQFKPSISHRFIKTLEDTDQLLRNYTQNIDTLERQTGITKVIECHGSFSKATCTRCLAKFDGDVIKEDVKEKRVAICTKCQIGVIKPDIVFFGEDLGQDFHRQMTIDKHDVDLVVVIGSSLKVRPVSLIPFSVSPDVPQILINREPLSSYRADIELLGNCDDVVREICLALGGPFVDMIQQFDNDVVVPSTLPSVSDKPEAEVGKNNRKRRMINMAEFHQIMNEEDKQVDEQDDEETNGEPSSKKPRANDPEDIAAMYQMRYVNIERKLPEHSYMQVTMNQTVFPGAEIVYDLDAHVVCRPPAPPRRGCINFLMDDEDDGECSDESEASEDNRPRSEPSISNIVEVELNSNSCDGDFSFDSSEPVTAEEFRMLMRNLCDEPF